MPLASFQFSGTLILSGFPKFTLIARWLTPAIVHACWSFSDIMSIIKSLLLFGCVVEATHHSFYVRRYFKKDIVLKIFLYNNRHFHNQILPFLQTQDYCRIHL